MLTEIGRQPWAVHGYVTTAQAVTKTNDISSFGYIFPLAYLLLFIVTILAILKLLSPTKNRLRLKMISALILFLVPVTLFVIAFPIRNISQFQAAQ